MDRPRLLTQTSPTRPARWENEEKEEEKEEEEEEEQNVAFHNDLSLNRFVYCLFAWDVSIKRFHISLQEQQYTKHVFEIELY